MIWYCWSRVVQREGTSPLLTSTLFCRFGITFFVIMALQAHRNFKSFYSVKPDHYLFPPLELVALRIVLLHPALLVCDQILYAWFGFRDVRCLASGCLEQPKQILTVAVHSRYLRVL